MSFWAEYERKSRERIAARAQKAGPRCAVCGVPVLRGKRCPTHISDRAEGDEQKMRHRQWRQRHRRRRA